jgi:hypothetical protein
VLSGNPKLYICIKDICSGLVIFKDNKIYIRFSVDARMTKLNLPDFEFIYKEKNNKKYIFDELRRKYLLLTPEEWVRQNFVKYLVTRKSIPASLIALEMPFNLYTLDKRSDIAIYNKQGIVVLLVECKSPDISITQKIFDQAAGYNLKLNAKILIITNGLSHYCYKPDYENNKWIFLDAIPDFNELNSIFVD